MSHRTRVRLVVAFVAAAAALVAVAVAVVPAGEEEPRRVAELRSAVREDPGNAQTRVQLGVALFESGEEEAAREQWAEVERRSPDSPAALRAESLRHPEMPPGRPFFYPRGVESLPSGTTIAAQVDSLAQEAEEGGSDEWLAYGTVLQRVGRPLSARRAFERALELEPQSLDAQVAAAVGRFDKDNPSAAFSRLGPLTRGQPRAGIVRFHLGLMLLWLGQLEAAKAQLERAVAAEPDELYGKEAQRLLDRLEEIRS